MSSCDLSAAVRFEQAPHGWNGVPSPVRHVRGGMACLLTGDTHLVMIKMMSAEFLLIKLLFSPR